MNSKINNTCYSSISISFILIFRVCPKVSTFKSHLTSSSQEEEINSSKASFKSHLDEGISKEEMDFFLS